MKKSRISEALSGIIDLILAGILWLLCSLPVFTLGASTCALYYSVVKCVRHNRGRLVPTFFRGFRSNFRIATSVWLLMLVYAAVGLADAYAFGRMGYGEGTVLHTLSRIFFFPLFLFYPWVFAYISRFENTVKGTLKFCGWMTLRYLGKTILLTVTLLAGLLICWLLPMLVPILPGAWCLLMSLVIEPVFRSFQSGTPDSNADPWYNE